MERHEIGSDDLLGSLPVSAEVEGKIDFILHEISYTTARFVAAAGCIMYFTLALAHQFVLPRPLSTTMTLIALGSSFVMAGAYFALRRRFIRVERANLVMLSLIGIFSLNAFAQTYLAYDIIQTTNILLVLVNAGYAFLFTRWFHVTVALILGAWLVVFSTLPDKSNLVHFGFALAFAVATGYVIHFNRIRSVREQVHLRIQSDQLLLNTLPNSIARRLKAGETMIADDHDAVTVLFADIVNFTPLSASMTPRELVVLLNQVFSAFDRLARKYGLEKIKTIGDAYMAVAGVPLPMANHAEAAAQMAIELQREIKQFTDKDGNPLKLRIGLHSGPVVAGVIGMSKFSYDLWGDTVNTASRMESQGMENAIQVSEETYRYLRGAHEFVERGVVHIKGKGDMKVYCMIDPRGASICLPSPPSSNARLRAGDQAVAISRSGHDPVVLRHTHSLSSGAAFISRIGSRPS